MILIDSSIWINWLRSPGPELVESIERIAVTDDIVTGDFVLAEVLQGCRDDLSFQRTLRRMTSFRVVSIAGTDVSVEAARNYRRLRLLGITVRKTIDVLIATHCIVDGYRLLHADRDFDAFERHLGLAVVPLR